MGMRFLKVFCLTAAVAAASVLVSCDSGGGQESASKKSQFNREDEKHQSSYVIGRSMGSELKSMEEIVDVEVVVMAIREAYGGSSAQLPDSAIAAIDARTRQALRNKQAEKQRLLEEGNLEASTKFLEKNKENEGVITTESGLQYIVLKEGDGPAKPTLEELVKVHYHGTLLDGTVFDSSVDRGEPITLAVNGVIRGWTEALQLMKVGSKFKIFVPSEMAYGRRGARAPIGPNMALIFEIELLGIEKRRE